SDSFSDTTKYVADAFNVNYNTIKDRVEGGYTYLFLNASNSYFRPNLSDFGLIIPPYFYTDLMNNRIFGNSYVNITQSAKSNAQVVVNATDLVNYQIETFTQGVEGAGSQGYPAYSVLLPDVRPKALTGVSAVDVLGGSLTYKYLPSYLTNYSFPENYYLSSLKYINLFNFYQATLNNVPLSLIFGSAGEGYRRVILVFNDRFNNTIALPIDADVANLTTINLSVTPVVSSSNANQTALFINGSVFYQPTALSSPIPLRTGEIYLYFDQNINFVNYNALQDPTNAIMCAYFPSDMPPGSCTPANPSITYLSSNANVTTFYAPTACGPPASSFAPVNLNCNIFSNPSCPSANGAPQTFCEPLYSNGSGICTSQLGLIGIADVSNGKFSYNVKSVCGTGTHRIIAEFYGYPFGQPISVYQPPLYLSANYFGSYNPPFNALNYTWSPAFASQVVSIGSYLLSFGNVNAAIGALLVLLSLFAAILFKRKKFK
ncbi:MAG: hypothetical protein QXL16_03050, partial [Candidatus Micrarchaeaceae archaeon]